MTSPEHGAISANLTFEIDGSPDLIGERELGRYFRTETDEVEALVEEHRSEAS